MITFLGMMEKSKEEEKCLDKLLWHACAGGIVQMPSLNSKVFYFPQGHAEHANGVVDFNKCRRFPLPSYILCRVKSIKYMADHDTDEVYAKLMLVPLNRDEADYDENNGADGSEDQDNKLASFAKTLTQSDANNGGGFSVPRYCAETIFPRLNFKENTPLQIISAIDVHGEKWKFKHIYRGTPRRHLLTTGWSPFVNKKKLVAGDSVVFSRGRDEDIHVGVRRAKREHGRRFEYSSLWNSEDESRCLPHEGCVMGNGKLKAEAVVEAANLAANGQPFEVMYYPGESTPQFCVKASSVKTALQIGWCPGMRFKMAFETEDPSRISWFMGTISSVQVSDPLLCPDSPWRLLQVTWDEPDLRKNVKRVSPWWIELVSNMPAIPPPFSPPRKRMRLSQHPADVVLDPPTFAASNLLGPINNPFGYYVPETTPAGMQGARHGYYGLPLRDLRLNKLQNSPLCLTGRPPIGQASMQTRMCYSSSAMQKPSVSENVPLSMSNENSAQSLKERDDNKTPYIVLFGKIIIPTGNTTPLCGNAHKGTVLLDGVCPESDQSNLDGGRC